MQAINDFLDGVGAGAFKTDAAGRILFFPNGVMKGGVVVPDEPTRDRLRLTLRHMYAWVFGFIAITSALSAPLVNLVPALPLVALFAVALAVIAVLTRRTMAAAVAGLEPAGTSLSLGEAFAGQARAMPRWFFITEAVFSALMVLGGIWMTLAHSADGDRFKGLAAAAIFGLLFAWSARGLQAKSRSTG